jgi:hypothetical protein
MLWILVPVWLGWFFAEFYQEKVGTSMGNAISNSTIIVWAAIDAARQTVKLMSAGTITGFLNIAARFFLILVLFGYGILIIILGIRGNRLIQYIGRIREITYVFVIFVPVFYNAIPFSFKHIIAAVVFFPVFYFFIELIDKITPNPKAIVEDQEDGQKGSSGSSDLSFDKPADAGKTPDLGGDMNDFGKMPAGGKDDFKF